MHGYGFSVVGIGRSPDTNVKKINLKHALDLDRRGLLHRQYNLPPTKDTIAVPNNGYVVLRFRADNPGKLNRLIITFKNNIKLTFTIFYRFLVIPLSFLVPYCYWYEFDIASWYKCRFATSTTRFPNMW